LLRCSPLSAFVVARHHAAFEVLITGRFWHQSSSIALIAAAAAAAGPPPPPPPPPWSNSPSSIAKERGNSSSTTSIPTAAQTLKCQQVQMTWTYLTHLQYLNCVMMVKGIYQLASCWLKKIVPFLRSSYSKMTISTFFGGGDQLPFENGGNKNCSGQTIKRDCTFVPIVCDIM
jgi:hypothetical protein